MEILIAGSDTTAFTISIALLHILRNEGIKNKLTRAVTDAIKDPKSMPSYTELSQVEYLVSGHSIRHPRDLDRTEMLMREQRAVVKESLRIAMPVPGMLPRIVPATSTPFVVDGQVVPPGVISSPC